MVVQDLGKVGSTVAVGEVKESGQHFNVENSGTSVDAVLDFTFPEELTVSNAKVEGNWEIDGDLTITGNVYQKGDSYETHAEEFYTTKDLIITREGSESALADDEYTGLQATMYDGTNDGRLVFGNDGVARVGDYRDGGEVEVQRTTNAYSTDGVTFYKTSDLVNTVDLTGVSYTEEETVCYYITDTDGNKTKAYSSDGTTYYPNKDYSGTAIDTDGKTITAVKRYKYTATVTKKSVALDDTQPLATREESPIEGGVAVWNSSSKRFDTKDVGDLPVTYEGVEDTLNNTIPKLGKVKTVNEQSPDSDGNIQTEVTLTLAEYEQLETLGEVDDNVAYYISDDGSGTTLIDDSTVSSSLVWSSQKMNDTFVKSSSVVDAVTDGDMNPVTSNAVNDSLANYQTKTVTDLSSLITVSVGTVSNKFCKKVGQLVSFEVDFTVSNLSTNTLILTNLPKPVLSYIDITISCNGSMNARAVLFSSGIVIFYYTESSSSTFSGLLSVGGTYITSD